MDPGTPIYHLALRAHWENARAAGEYRQSTIDRTLEEEGFIHCSFAEQVEGTVARYYDGIDDIVLLTIDPAQLADVRVENGFPHIYGPLPITAVIETKQYR